MFKQIHMLDNYDKDCSNIKQEHFDHMFYLLDNIQERGH